MNTSDQSLFPIDSAFKRRWDWKYVPISDQRKGWQIVADGKRFDWWTFLEKINEVIGTTTDSEDKKLGYFFVKVPEGGPNANEISADVFVAKVAFYLWNDVFKNYGFDNKIFEVNGQKERRTFASFFNADGSVIGKEVVAFLSKVCPETVTPDPPQDLPSESAPEDAADVGQP